MTLQDLQKLFPDATEFTWHQHPYGGGWVENTARVDASAYVGPDARVSGNALVFGNSRVYGDAQVYGYTLMCENAVVSGNYSDTPKHFHPRWSGDVWKFQG